MPHFKCYPITDPNSQWNYCPSYSAAIAFGVLFSLATLVHIFQAILYRKPFAVVLIMGAAWEAGGYIFRIFSVEHQLNQSYATAQQLLILLAPLWINAFAYMTIGRAIHFYLSNDRIFGVKARKITLMFVLFDISSFVVQAVAGVMTTPSSSISTQHLGLHIYMGGVGLQLLYNTVFITLTARFQYILTHSAPPEYGDDPTTTPPNPIKTPHNAKRLILYPVYAVLTLIVYRNIYRLIEFSAGVDSTITTHEWYTWVFDSLPMFSCLATFAAFHPGRALRGPRSDFSEENRAMREAKRRGKREKKQAKGDKKRLEREVKRTKGVAKEERRREKISARLERKSVEMV